MSQSNERLAEMSAEEKRALLAQLLQKKARQSRAAHPLSHGQQAMWFLHQLAPESAAYNVAFTARVRSEVDVPALERTLQALIDRHLPLRTTYTMQDGKPVQEVHGHQDVYFEEVDASDWNDAELNEQVVMAYRRPYDLENGPVLRVTLFTCAATDHVLLIAGHHIIFDGWSMWVFLDEFRQLYVGEKTGVPASLPPLAVQYTDFVRWQAELLASAEGERLWTYWQKQLGGDPSALPPVAEQALPVLNLPTDRPRPPIQTFNGATHEFALGEDLSRRLKEFAKAEQTTLYTVLISAFHVMLYRYTNQEDIIIGSPMAGRSRPEFANLVGDFINIVALRANLSGNPSFRTFLGQMRQTVLDALAHQDYPFSLLVERLVATPDPSRSPLFQVTFDLQRVHRFGELVDLFMPGKVGGRVNVGGLELESFPLAQQEGQLDLNLQMLEVDELLSGALKYNTDLFDASTIERMLGHFRTLLEGIVADPHQQLSDLPLLAPAERHQLLIEWNNTQANYSQETLHQLFETQVEQTPDSVAFVFQNQSLTYRELNRRANQLAHHLQSAGVGPETLVGICVTRSLDMIVGVLGILKAGGTYLPLDPAYPKERLSFMLEDAQVPLLLTQQPLVDWLPPHNARIICLDSDWLTIAKESIENLHNTATPDNPVYLIYTSGSTGTPKGVLGLHRGAINRFSWMWQTYPFAPGEKSCQKTFLSFVDSVWELFGPLLQGVPTVVIPDEVVRDAQSLVQLLGDEEVTRIVLVPSLLRVIVESFPDLQRRLPKLRYWVASGEMLPVELCRRFHETMPQSILINLYGSSEVAADATVYDTANGETPRSIPIGRPLSNIQVYILDAHLNPVPVGVVGELYVGGAGLARGYLNRPELTAQRFILRSFDGGPEMRLYKTGDLARYLPDGNIEYMSRIDHQVKVRGFRIELGEIETTLVEHPAIKETVVVVREDALGDKRIVAYIVPAPGQAPTVSELRNYLRERLPDYMVPTSFILLDVMPLTPSGKVNRLALPAPELRRLDMATAPTTSLTPMESLLVKVWQDALKVDQISAYDNFFDLGGHSLLSMAVVTRMGKETGVKLNPAYMRVQTLGQLAAMYEDQQRNPRPATPPNAESGVTRKLLKAFKRAVGPKEK